MCASAPPNVHAHVPLCPPSCMVYRNAPLVVQVRELGLSLPPLCSCNSGVGVLDTRYVWACCRNCELYGRPERYEQLLTAMLRTYDVI